MSEVQQATLFDPPLPDPSRQAVGKFEAPTSVQAATSRAAAVLVYPTSGIARERVLAYIVRQGEQGATDDELQGVLVMNPSTQRPRRVELVEDGWIEDSGRTRRTVSKRDAVVWVLTPAGRASVAS